MYPQRFFPILLEGSGSQRVLLDVQNLHMRPADLIEFLTPIIMNYFWIICFSEHHYLRPITMTFRHRILLLKKTYQNKHGGIIYTLQRGWEFAESVSIFIDYSTYNIYIECKQKNCWKWRTLYCWYCTDILYWISIMWILEQPILFIITYTVNDDATCIYLL